MSENGLTIDPPPLVTFALLGYRQEDLIEAAIESAFSQDYPHLEVILSDDASPDRTFEKMEEAAASFRGSHRIRLNRNAENIGLLPHLYKVMELARGELVVVAAGDDISYPNRVSKLVEHWQKENADVLFSRYDIISEDGRSCRPCDLPENPNSPSEPLFPESKVPRIFGAVMGATACYKREIISNIKLPPPEVVMEDIFFSLMSALHSKKVFFVNEALVGYREHSGSSTSKPQSDWEQVERSFSSAAKKLLETLSFFERAVLTGVGVNKEWGSKAEVDLSVLRRQKLFFEVRSRWIEEPVAGRLRYLVKMRSYSHFRWFLPRLFGLRTLSLARRILRM